VGWIVVFVALLPVILAAGLEIWEGCIRVRQIPPREIVSLASELRQKHGTRAAEIAFINEDRAWRYSDSFERGKWRRVKRHLQKSNNFPLQSGIRKF